jgi:putative SOS response-associated peptidase YedK
VIKSVYEARFMLRGFPCIISGKRPHINARSETAATSKTFSAAMASRRCLVPASGYFEWKTLGKNRKEKYGFRLPGMSPMYMAGIYSGDGRFAILTRDAAPGILEIHNRMPVILPKTLKGAWFGGSPGVLSEALTDLRSCSVIN